MAKYGGSQVLESRGQTLLSSIDHDENVKIVIAKDQKQDDVMSNGGRKTTPAGEPGIMSGHSKQQRIIHEIDLDYIQEEDFNTPPNETR